MRVRTAQVVFLTAVLAPLSAEAGGTVGVLLGADMPYFRAVHATLTAELAKQSGVELVVQTPAGDRMAWVNAARRFEAVGANVVVAYGATAAQIAVSESGDLPIVYVASHSSAFRLEGTKTTGVSWRIPILTLLKRLKDVTPYAKLGVVMNPDEPDTVQQLHEVEALADELGAQVVGIAVRQSGDAGKRMRAVEAVYLTTGCATTSCSNDVLGAAKAAKISAAAPLLGMEEQGALLTMSPSPAEVGKAAAGMVARILAGEKPAVIPVVTPKRIEFIVNVAVAEGLGLKVPVDVLTGATRVIK